MTGQGGGLAAAWYRGAWWLWLLRPLELLFRVIASCRRALFRMGIFKSYHADKPLVVVGNITVGGTGKTPVVIALVEALQQRGLRVGVVSRGYGAEGAAYPHTVSAVSSAEQCGDEPLLIFHRTGAPCVVDPDRGAAVASLLAQFEVDIVLSDDGLQHYSMQRDLEIVLIDAERGLGNGFCLPAGPLREPASRLRTVDHLLYRNGQDPASAVSYQPEAWVNTENGERRELDAFAGQPDILLMAGIGQPEQFFSSVYEFGVRAETREYPDHHRFSPGDFTGLKGRTILMTEKDAVKCTSLAGPDAWYLRISARLPEAVPTAVAALAATN